MLASRQRLLSLLMGQRDLGSVVIFDTLRWRHVVLLIGSSNGSQHRLCCDIIIIVVQRGRILIQHGSSTLVPG
jgi:hypothetical protein